MDRSPAGPACSTISPTCVTCLPAGTGWWCARSRPARAPGSASPPRRSPSQGGADPAGDAGLAGRAPRPVVRDQVRRRRGAHRAGSARDAAALRGGVLDGARAGLVGGTARGRGARRRDRGRHGRRPAGGAPGRAARRRAAGVAGPGTGGGGQLRAAVAERAHIVLALSPATLRKTGSGFDLALACGVLAAAGAVEQRALDGTVLLGELALDGRLRPVRGVLPCLLAARAAGIRRVVVPEPRSPRRRWSTGSRCSARRARAGAGLATGRGCWPGRARGRPRRPAPLPDLADVVGQDDARRALEVAAAGGHHLLLVGPPGTGKTMLAQRIVGLLPELSSDEALALAAIRSVAGRLPAEGLTRGRRSWRRTTRRRWRRWSAGAAGSPGRARCRSRTGARCSWTRRRSSRATCSTRCARRWRRARSGSPARTALCAIPARFQLVLAANPCPCAPAARPRLRLPVARAPPLPRAAVGAAARPRRPAGPDVPRHRPVRGGRAGREHGDGPRPRARRSGGGRGTLGGARLAVQRGGARPRAAHPVRAAGAGRPAAGRRAAQRRADGARRRPRAARRLDGGRPAGARPAGPRSVEQALYFRDRRAA